MTDENVNGANMPPTPNAAGETAARGPSPTSVVDHEDGKEPEQAGGEDGLPPTKRARTEGDDGRGDDSTGAPNAPEGGQEEEGATGVGTAGEGAEATDDGGLGERSGSLELFAEFFGGRGGSVTTAPWGAAGPFPAELPTETTTTP